MSLLAALLSGSFAVGAAIGAALGAARWLSALPGVHAAGPEGLARLAATVRRLEAPSRRVALGAQAAVLVVLLAVALT